MSAFRLQRLQRKLTTIATLASLGLGPSFLAGCHGGHSTGAQGPAAQRVTGQTEFTSAPQLGQAGRGAGNASFGASGGGSSSSGGGAPVAAPSNGATSASSSSSSSSSTRTVSETDLYAVEGNRLYYLNSYRGLMVFDITNPDAPALIGRSPIFGDPQEMTVQNGICVVVVGDWYGMTTAGIPFHGSIVRGLDATDPTNIKVVGEAQLGGYVQDTRVVGNVLYAVIEDYGWEYGWYDGWGGYYGGGGDVGVAVPAGGGGYGYGYGYGTNPTPVVAVASVSFAGGVVTPVGYQTFPGTGGVFNVTPNAIMLATNVTNTSTTGDAAGQTNLTYIDISDPGGAIKTRGQINVSGAVTGWGPDNGRWNLDFADGVNAHSLGCGDAWCGDSTDSYILSTVDFSNPDSPAIKSTFPIANLGWSAAALFSGTQLYLSPSNDYYGSSGTTPFSLYDISNPAAPTLAGTTNLDGSTWIYRPDGTKLFSIGSSAYNASAEGQGVEVQYLDVSNPKAPAVIGKTTFGAGWAWSPAASTFKAITIDDTKDLMVVPFSGWDYSSYQYTNGVQVIQYSPTTITSSATAFSKGWVQRGIFVGNRLFSISDQALAVVDYSNPASPTVKTQLTLARNVVNAQPQGATIAELSSDWWGNDVTTSEMRVLPIANAAETSDNGTGVSANIAGVGAQVFQNGNLAYVVTDVQHPAPCNEWNSSGPSTGTGCTAWGEQVQVVDTSGGGVKLRGQITLPDTPYGWGGWGWGGFWWYDWYDGSEIVQVGGDALAFRRWFPTYAPVGPGGDWEYIDALDALFVIDLKNPDAPTIASTTVTDDSTAWWGDVQAIGNTLYTTHYEWVERPDPSAPTGTLYYVKYYLDQVDLTDRAHPVIGSKINVPGQLVGASASDPSILYMIDYRWDSSNNPTNELDVVKIDGGLAYLQSVTTLDGWVGQVIVHNDVAYASVQEYDWMCTNGYCSQPYVELHQINLSNPNAPVDFVATDPHSGWGWLLGVQGDRAIITSGWGPMGYDIYKLSPSSAPVFDQSVRALGWGPNSILRQDNTLYISSGYWGVQPVVLQ
jgi:hypothetical protein